MTLPATDPAELAALANDDTTMPGESGDDESFIDLDPAVE